MNANPRLGPLDGLRGIAILLVVWFHIWQISWLPAPAEWLQFLPETGFAGVDLFFFISGFVIVYPFLVARRDGAPPPSWRHFALRRFLKIVPSYVLSIAVLVLVGYASFPSFARAVTDIGAHLLFVNVWWESTFGSINGVLWSLAVEVQFYVLFPLLWPAFRRRPWLTAAAMTVTAIAFRQFAGRCCLHDHAPYMIDNLPGTLDLFAAGMIGAYVFVTYRDRIDTRASALGGLAVALAGAAMFVALLMNLYDFRHTDMWLTIWQISNRTWLGVAALCVGTGVLFGPVWAQRGLGNPVLLFFAAISYNWYLYHQAVARGLLYVHLPPFQTKLAVDDPHWQSAFSALAFVASLAVATLATFAVERPLLRAGGSRRAANARGDAGSGSRTPQLR